MKRDCFSASSARPFGQPVGWWIGIVLGALAVCLLLPPGFAAAQTFDDPGFSSEQVAAGFAAPIGFTFVPDGRIFVWMKEGKIVVIKDGALLATPFLDISDHTNRFQDRGLTGVALDPDFTSNGLVYLAYVYEPPGGNTQSDRPRTQRVTRVQVDPSNPDRALPGSETVILGFVTDPSCNAAADCIPNDHGVHTINQLSSGVDGKLYVGVGDGSSDLVDAHTLRSQDVNSLAGKILRINTDGTGPGDNPFYDGNPNSNRSKVFAYGLRNPYRFSFDAGGNIYIGDVGWLSYEEVDRGKGGNFGWPCYEGPNPQSTYQSSFGQCSSLTEGSVVPPLLSYPQSGAAVTGKTIVVGPVYNGAAYPGTYRGNLFYADFVEKWLRRIVFDASGAVTADQRFATNLGTSQNPYDGPVHLQQGPEGDLYYLLLDSQQLRRIRFSGLTNGPPRAVASANPTAGLSPLDVMFSSDGSSDPEGMPLTYAWDFGDGTASAESNPVHRYTAGGVQKFAAKLTVRDAGGASVSADVAITVGSRLPTATILTPADGAHVQPGQTIAFRGRATDPEDGNLTGTALKWQVWLVHTDHRHFVVDTTGEGGSFVVEDHGPSGTFSYQITLTATDSSGLTDAKTVTLPIGDFIVSASPSSATAIPGQSATFTITVAPATGSSAFSQAVALSCADLPAGVSCTVSPATVIPGTGSATASLTVTASPQVLGMNRVPAGLSLAFGLPVFGLAVPWAGRRRRSALLLGLGFTLLWIALHVGCSGTAGNGRSSSFPVTITGTSGSLSHNATVNLTVR